MVGLEALAINREGGLIIPHVAPTHAIQHWPSVNPSTVLKENPAFDLLSFLLLFEDVEILERGMFH